MEEKDIDINDEEQRLKNVIALINNKIKYNEELFNKQKIQ